MNSVLHINTGLPSILLLRRIDACESWGIRGLCFFDGKGAFALIEAMAQLGAFHLRKRDDFRRHAFLVKVSDCTIPEPIPAAGFLNLEGRLTAGSDRSAAYRLCAARGAETVITGDFLFSTVDYDERFAGERLSEHYERIFACLTSASGID